MGRRKKVDITHEEYDLPAYASPEALENAMIAKSMQLAYKQLCDGTASSQVITHFLKLGTMKEKVELEKLKKENELITAKTDSIKNAQYSETLYKEAIDAFKVYSGKDDAVDDENIFGAD